MNKYIFALAVLPFLSSCVEDEGNYDYRTLNEVSLDGMEAAYNALGHIDHIQISPEIEGTLYGDNLDNYVYEWHVCTGVFGNNVHKHTVIGNEKDLDWLVELDPGSYTIYLVIKDKETSIETSFSTSLTVSSPFSRGFLVLGDADNNRRLGLDMLTMVPERDTIMVEDAMDNSELNLSKAQKLYYSGYYITQPGQSLYLMTEDDTYLLMSRPDASVGEVLNFEPVSTFHNQNIIDCEYDVNTPMKLVDAYPQGAFRSTIALSRSCRFYLTEDGVFGGMIMGEQYFAKPFNRYSANGPLFHFYPCLFMNYSYISSFNAIGFLYDSDNDCFVRFNGSGSYSTAATTENGTWSYDLRSQGRKLIYGANSYSSTCWSNFIVKDDQNNYYIYRMVVPTSQYANSTNKVSYNVDLSVAKDFDKASFYAFANTRSSIIYSVGKTLYHYDFANNRSSKVDFDSEICFLDTEYQSYLSTTDLILATWSDSQKGMIYKYEIDDNPNSIEIKPRENEAWPTRLKVKDIKWFMTN